MENVGEFFLAGGLLFGGIAAPVLAAVEEYPAAGPQPTIVRDDVKHFFKGVLQKTKNKYD